MASFALKGWNLQMPPSSVQQRPWHYRIPKKSRNGCQQCKRRKVKCDEQGPRCRNCRHRKTQCSFESQCAPKSHSAPSPAPETHASTSIVQGLGQQPVRSLDDQVPVDLRLLYPSNPDPVEDLELMYHYTTVTFLSFIDYDMYKPVWEVDIPREARSQQFLMHLILAVSALHINHLWTSKNLPALSYKEAAQRHYNAAVTIFRSTVPTMTKSNTSAVFAFSNLSIFFAFGSAQFSSRRKRLENPVDELLDIFILLRKAMATIRRSWHILEKSPLGILLQRGPQITDRRYLPVETSMALELMEQHCLHVLTLNSTESTLNPVYQKAIDQLWDSFVMAQTKRKDWSMALRFPMIFSDPFLSYLRCRDSVSLIILAHFCVILYNAPARWWAEGWSVQVINAIFENLPQNWRYTISWPMEVVGLAPTPSRFRIC
uniref:Zn(2)-C6 fungal-type domain-containing protein n=1 Tax=Coccidioides posadasii RMSCC 3488 TaxID=454284 RepID=A0A0J6FCX6_COCPO|nr:hypothetical protein CPAG_07245 [Coccidioides posadasii RMSCC 3488]